MLLSIKFRRKKNEKPIKTQKKTRWVVFFLKKNGFFPTLGEVENWAMKRKNWRNVPVILPYNTALIKKIFLKNDQK